MDKLEKAAEDLIAAGYKIRNRTPDGLFLNRMVNKEEEIAVYLTKRKYPDDKPGANVWLQVERNARQKYREDVEIDDPKGLTWGILNRAACLEATAAKSPLAAICTIMCNSNIDLSRVFAKIDEDVLSLEDDRSHKDYDRVKAYFEREIRKKSAPLPLGPNDLDRRLTPGLISKELGFTEGVTKPNYRLFLRKIADDQGSIELHDISSFEDGRPSSELFPSEGHLVRLHDRTSGTYVCEQHVPNGDDPAFGQELAMMVATAYEASMQSHKLYGADVCARYLAGGVAEMPDLEGVARDMTYEETYADLKKDGQQTLWVRFLDDLHERVFGFGYGAVQHLELEERSQAPAI